MATARTPGPRSSTPSGTAPSDNAGAQHVHHIDATDARLAPTFDQVVGDLTELLRGRVVAAHNATFDASFLAAGS